MLRFISSLFTALCMIGFVGCGTDRLPTAPASGEVTYDGEAITKGTITFIPVDDEGNPREGKSALGQIGENGSFVLQTYEENDGAILGKHQVVYSPPEDEGEEDEGEVQTTPDGEEVVSEPAEEPTGIVFELQVAEGSQFVEVHDRENSFSITLTKAEGEGEEYE